MANGRVLGGTLAHMYSTHAPDPAAEAAALSIERIRVYLNDVVAPVPLAENDALARYDALLADLAQLSQHLE